MIAADDMPLMTTERRGFKKFLKVVVPRYTPPSRKTITRYMDAKYDTLSSKVKSEFANRTKHKPYYWRMDGNKMQSELFGPYGTLLSKNRNGGHKYRVLSTRRIPYIRIFGKSNKLIVWWMAHPEIIAECCSHWQCK